MKSSIGLECSVHIKQLALNLSDSDKLNKSAEQKINNKNIDDLLTDLDKSNQQISTFLNNIAINSPKKKNKIARKLADFSLSDFHKAIPEYNGGTK